MRKKERYEKILAWFRENVPVAGLPYSRSTRRYYSRRGIRVYPQRLLSQQQSQTSCRHGTDVGERIQQ